MILNRRRLKIVMGIGLLGLILYVGAFCCVVRVVHVTYYYDGPIPNPPPPQYWMYTVRSSPKWNHVGHWLFAPLIWGCEATGEFWYEEDGHHVTIDGGLLAVTGQSYIAPKLVQVLFHR